MQSVIRQVMRGAGFGLLTLGCGTGVLIHVALARGEHGKAHARDVWAGSWSLALLGLFGVRVVVHGEAQQRGDVARPAAQIDDG